MSALSPAFVQRGVQPRLCLSQVARPFRIYRPANAVSSGASAPILRNQQVATSPAESVAGPAKAQCHLVFRPTDTRYYTSPVSPRFATSSCGAGFHPAPQPLHSATFGCGYAAWWGRTPVLRPASTPARGAKLLTVKAAGRGHPAPLWRAAPPALAAICTTEWHWDAILPHTETVLSCGLLSRHRRLLLTCNVTRSEQGLRDTGDEQRQRYIPP